MHAEVRGQPGGICVVDSGISRPGSSFTHWTISQTPPCILQPWFGPGYYVRLTRKGPGMKLYLMTIVWFSGTQQRRLWQLHGHTLAGQDSQSPRDPQNYNSHSSNCPVSLLPLSQWVLWLDCAAWGLWTCSSCPMARNAVFCPSPLLVSTVVVLPGLGQFLLHTLSDFSCFLTKSMSLQLHIYHCDYVV